MSTAKGFTLLELMVSVSVLTLISAVLFMVAANLGAVAQSQEARVSSQDQARNAMMRVTREIRNASRASIDMATLPGPSLTFQKAADLDGNGTAVDVGGFLELGPVTTIGRDLNDANNDGLTTTQLILSDPNGVRVLANGLVPDEDMDADGLLDANEDANGNGALDRGIWFEPVGTGIRVTLQIRQRSSTRGYEMDAMLTEIVTPRN